MRVIALAQLGVGLLDRLRDRREKLRDLLLPVLAGFRQFDLQPEDLLADIEQRLNDRHPHPVLLGRV